MRLGETWLPVERVGDSSFAARVPSTFGGTYRVAIQLDGEVEELPPVEVAGMTEAQQHQAFYQLDLQVLPGTGKATIFGGADHLPGSDPQAPDYPLTLTDLTSGTTRQPGEVFYDFGGLRGPGASYLPGVYFGQTPEGSIQPFRIDAAGVTVDPSVTTLARTIIQIGPSSWARASHHYVHHVTDGSNRWITVEEAEGIAISHAAGRATFMADATPEGLPVFAMPEGTIAYFLTEVERAAGVDFSADGELLAVAGWELPSYTNDIIRTFRAADGQPVAERSLPGSPFAVAFDPVRPLIYVGLNAHEEAGELRAMSLLVLDRETLAVLGQMSTERSGL